MQYDIVVVHGEMCLSFLLSSLCSSTAHDCNSCHSLDLYLKDMYLMVHILAGLERANHSSTTTHIYL